MRATVAGKLGVDGVIIGLKASVEAGSGVGGGVATAYTVKADANTMVISKAIVTLPK